MPLVLSRVQALCFDVDGTLRDTDDQMVMRLANLLRLLGPLFPSHNPTPFARKVIMKIENPATFLYSLPDRLHIDHHVAGLSAQLHRFALQRGKGAESFLMIPGIKDMLSRLHQRFPLAIISARNEEGTYAFLEHFGLAAYFTCIVTGQTCQHTKPFPDPVLWAADKMGVPSSACLMIGDTTVDMLAGKSAGAQTVGVLCGFGEEAELRKAGADMVLSTTTDLEEYLYSEHHPAKIYTER